MGKHVFYECENTAGTYHLSRNIRIDTGWGGGELWNEINRLQFVRFRCGSCDTHVA